ncbi:MAG: twin-arginine translocation signal domain-containing protein [Gemmataceae bacterium]|nr:twin-arginine translocation signal domain-containing protein [Gemmataceae bacterium]
MDSRRHFLKKAALAAVTATLPASLADARGAATDLARLRTHCLAGLLDRYGERNHRDPAIMSRLDRELAIIDDLHLSDFFLVLAESRRVAARGGYPPTVVGAAAGSLVVHALGLSPVCPLGHRLLFDRFLAKSQRTAPSVAILVTVESAQETVRSIRDRHAQVGIDDLDRPFRALKRKWRPNAGGQSSWATLDVHSYFGLSVTRKAIQLVDQRGHSTIRFDDLPKNDPQTLALFRSGSTDGVFQFQTTGMQNILRKLKPARFDDLVAAIALYRPGPIYDGIVAAYIDQKPRMPALIAHRLIEDVVTETREMLIYDEQAMEILHRVGGVDLADGFHLVKATRTRNHAVIADNRERFILGAHRLGTNRHDANMIFDCVVSAGKHTFCKAHATVYAWLAYGMAFLKVHFPSEFREACHATGRSA